MPPSMPARSTVPIEFDALTSDPRIKDVEMRPGAAFEMGSGRRLKTMAGSGGCGVRRQDRRGGPVCPHHALLCPRVVRQCTPCREARVGWRGFAHVWRKAKVGPGISTCWPTWPTGSRAIPSAPWRGRCLAHAGVPHKFRADFEARLPKAQAS